METSEMDERLRLSEVLVTNLRTHHQRLVDLLTNVGSDYYEEPIYRFYYQSFKVYSLQGTTKAIVESLEAIAPEGKPFCPEFQQIVQAGTQKVFTMEVNQRWLAETAPIVEAFFHAKYFLEVAVKYGNELESAPQILPFGFAALLCLFEIR